MTDVADFRAPGGTRARPPVGLEPTEPRAAERPAAGRHASGTDPVDIGRPGASARREYERLLARREAWIRSAHPHIGGFLLAVTDEPATTRAWALAARGEQRLARRLAKLHDDRILLLHDRGNSGSAANIDLLAVTPSGVYVISVKADKGRPRLKVEGGFIRPRTSRLVIGKRDGTDLVQEALRQVVVVRSALAQWPDVPVRGVLCFGDADWPPIGGAFVAVGLDVVWPGKVAALLQQPGPISAIEQAAVHRCLAAAFPVA